MRALLDVNVLLALFDLDHADHERARAWLDREIGEGWASCPLTQNGFVRILSQPRYPSPVSPAEAMRRLRLATRTRHHEFWPDDLSTLDEERIDPERILGHRQVTDAYLLALSVAHGGRFVTFERRVPAPAVAGAKPAHLVVL